MDRGLAMATLFAIPALAVLFYLLAESSPRPLVAYLIAMATYWLLLGLAIWGGGWSLALRWPPIWLTALVTLALVLLSVWALPAALRLSPHVLIVVTVAAVLNGTLEEAFWRGALVPDLVRGSGAILPVLLFAAWHLAPAAGLSHLDAPGGAVGLVVAALALGIVMMALRLTTGTAGAAAVVHVLVNLGTFSIFAARNPAPV